jgi:hypothetical protein
MSRSVRNTAVKTRNRSRRASEGKLPKSGETREPQSSIPVDTAVYQCLYAAHQETSRLLPRFTELQLAIALSLLASRRLRQACERGDCSRECRDEICKQFKQNAQRRSF